MWDTIALAAPIPGSYAGKALNWLNDADNLSDASRTLRSIADSNSSIWVKGIGGLLGNPQYTVLNYWGTTADGYNQGIRHFFDYGKEMPNRLETIAKRLGRNSFELTEAGFKEFTDAALDIVNNYEDLGGKMRQNGKKSFYYYNDVVVVTYDGKLQSVMPSNEKYFNKMK